MLIPLESVVIRYALLFSAALLLLTACGSDAPSSPLVTIPGRCAARVQTPQSRVLIPNIGFTLSPLGRLTKVGNLPLGGAMTPDGKQYWAVDSGYGLNDVQIVDISSGAVLQILPLPGAYGGMAFSPDGLTAYVSGEPVAKQGSVAPQGLQGVQGDVIHVFTRDPVTGLATEQTPINLPATSGGNGRNNTLPSNPAAPAWPSGLAISPDGKTLVVALNMADKAAVISLPSGTASTVVTGNYPYAAAIERTGRFAYVSNELDGTLTKIDLKGGNSTSSISGLGGSGGDYNAHPQNLVASTIADRLYVAVTNRDLVAVIDTSNDAVVQLIPLARPEGPGVAPVALALAPDGSTLYVANAGENAIVAISLTARPGGAQAYSVLGKIPTADYPHDVQISPDGCTMVWTAARGIGTVPNPGYQFWTFGAPLSPYPSYTEQLLTGQVSVLPVPSDAYFAQAQGTVDAATIPGNGKRSIAPAGSPVVGAYGGPSDQIKYVFYVVRENRTYDQIFGSDPRGDGDRKLQMFDDNNAPAPLGGMTPNAHALSRQFVLLDRFFEDSEVSLDGHVITSSAYATDYTVKGIHGNYSQRGKPFDFGIYPVSFPPKGFLFDALVRHKPAISFRNYGEISAGILNSGEERTDTYAQVRLNTDPGYPTDLQVGCAGAPAGAPNSPNCWFDAGLGATPPLAKSRMDVFKSNFVNQLAAGQVPRFNYLVLPSDHTTGVNGNVRDPLAMVADNDLGLGQLVQVISNSTIWPQSVIFVIEDDSQDGADHVDAHRAPALVIGPWVKHGGILVHTHYDQYSVIRTIELILGLDPLSIHDANAVPMFDVFATTADTAQYTAILPTQNIQAMCPCTSSPASIKLSAALPWDQLDAVPQELSDRLLWHRIHGAKSTPPSPVPHASRAEHERAVGAMNIYARYGGKLQVVRRKLSAYLGGGDND